MSYSSKAMVNHEVYVPLVCNAMMLHGFMD